MSYHGDAPLVSIGIPTRNRVGSLSQSIGSALNQDHPNVEVIVSDNASTDATPEFLGSLQRSHPGLIVIVQETDIGAAANFAAVLAAANGAYFAWLADDDRLSPNYVSSALSVLNNDPRAAIVGATAIFTVDAEARLRSDSLRDANALPTAACYVVSLWRVLFRRVLRSMRARRKYGTVRLDLKLPGLEFPAGCVGTLERPVRAQSRVRIIRIIKYAIDVTHNSIYYGLARTSLLRSNNVCATGFADDWVHCASLAVAGSLVTAHDAVIWRSRHGVSSDFSALAARYGHRFPAMALAFALPKALLCDYRFRRLYRVERLLAAGAVWCVLFWRYVFVSRLHRFCAICV